jgi:hypothetical protein
VVAAGDRLRSKVYPELDAGLSYSATYVAVEVVFADGTRLEGARDQYGKAADAAGQGAAKILYADQWNDVQVDLTAAAGKTIAQVVLVVDAPEAGHEFAGWIDDVEIGPAPAEPDGSDLVAYVDTRRGTNASHDFSRGNTLPITAWPNGFNFLTPVTNASTHRWPYEYHRANNADNRPELQGLTFSHQPSPWMGDRDQLTIMPVAAAEPLGDPAERAAAFSHDDETARPDLYAVDLAGGVRAELTPTDHGAILRFTFPDDAPGRHLIFDTIDENGAFEYDGNALTGWVENGSETGRTRMYCYGEFSTAPTAFGEAHGGRANARAATFDVPEVTLRIATSFIGVDQARHNLELELEGRSFEEIQAAANAVWNERLQVIRPEGATPPQLRTVYGNLYRLNLYPNSLRERGYAGRTGVPLREPGPANERYADRAGDQCGRQDRQDVREQRVLGHVPDRVAGVRVLLPGADRGTGRRVRAAVPRRRLDRALVLARVRGLHDRDELGRVLRGRVPQGRGVARPVGDVRRRTAQRDRRAGGDRGRTEGRRDGVLRRVREHRHRGERVVGSRGVPERLRAGRDGHAPGRRLSRAS